MPGLPFPQGAAAFAYESPDDPQTGPEDELLIDPALRQPSEPVIDPSLCPKPTLIDSEHAPIPDPSQPEQCFFPPSTAFSPGPQGDPFAPQPADFIPIQQDPLPAPQPKSQKRRRKIPREGECGFCRGNDSSNKRGEPERMVSCSTCGRSGHPTCMDLEHMAEAIYGYEWTCNECTTCEICHSTEEERMLFCDSCDRGWHMYCMEPNLEESPPGKWFCPTCTGMPSGQCADPELEPEPDAIGEIMPPDDGSSCHELENGFRESSVASSSQAPVFLEARPTRSHRKSKKAAEAEADTQLDTEELDTPAPRTRTRVVSASYSASPRKSNRKRTADERSPSPTPKRPRLKVAPLHVPPPKRVVLKMSAKGKEREDSPDEDIVQDMFEDILDEEDRDTSRTSISGADIARFERSRAMVEAKAMPTKPPASEPMTPVAGPSSRSLRSSTLAHTSTPAVFARSESPAASTPGPMSAKPSGPRIRTIRFGPFDIQTWFDAPFPEEYSNIPDGRLWLCEFCLRYMKSEFTASRHRANDMGAQFIGYFSKEKRSPKDYNRKGWGNLLIEFSYLLSWKERRLGSPEKPLSGLGALGYKNYWTLAIMRYLHTAPKDPRLEGICDATSLTLEDAYNTLDQLGFISTQASSPVTPKLLPGQSVKYPKGRRNGVARRHLVRAQTHDDDVNKLPFLPPSHYEIHWDPDIVATYITRWEAKGYPSVKPDKLRWSPFLIARVKKSDVAGLSNDGFSPVVGRGSRELIPPVDTPVTPDQDQLAPWRSSPPGRLSRPSLKRPTHALGVPALRRLRSQGLAEPVSPAENGRQSLSPVKTPVGKGRSRRESRRPSEPSRKGSSRLPEPMNGLVDDDAAFAARLAREERLAARSLRSRSATISITPISPELQRSVALPTRLPSRKRRRIESSPEPESEHEVSIQNQQDDRLPTDVESIQVQPAVCDKAGEQDAEERSLAGVDIGRLSAPSDDTVFAPEANVRTVLAKESPSNAVLPLPALPAGESVMPLVAAAQTDRDYRPPQTDDLLGSKADAEGEDEDAEGDTDEDYT
ncbi:hypothetical protein K488DRAFT_70552 [Vararia minispora EC-137]|uniref:Uncharacterized protein n=1 Tax=Vararia minispora EC-137 TaxID=1314806 RepID=A0ACB8QL88_9AGAM|nr:hypothetical protein K488DRAFT_70552 [Vararia minispora EC-137]